MMISPNHHGRGLFLVFLSSALISAHPASQKAEAGTEPITAAAAAAAAAADAYAATAAEIAAAETPAYLAPFPNENSTDAYIIPDEYIIALFPASSYAALDAFMIETYSAPLDPTRVEVLVPPSDPPRFTSYLWAHGASLSPEWIYQVRTFPGTKRVSRNGYAQPGS